MMPNGVGKIEAIWLKRAHRGPMDPVSRAELVTGHGIVGDANATRTKRQVTLIEADLWDQVRTDLETPHLDPSLRRANLLIRGLPLAESRGRTLQVGPVRLLVHGETRPCRLMEDAHPGLQAALDPDWRGGVYAEVVQGGPIQVGDQVSWADSIPSPHPDPPNPAQPDEPRRLPRPAADECLKLLHPMAGRGVVEQHGRR